MPISVFSPPHVPELPARRLALRRSALLDTIRQRHSSRSAIIFRRHPRLALAAACCAFLAFIGTAVALTGYDFLGQQSSVDQTEWRPPALERIGPRQEVSRGSDWSFMAWRSASGICLAYAAGEGTSWARTCGRAPGSAPDSPHGSKYVLVFGMVPSSKGGASDGRGAIFGAAQPDVGRVAFELADGRTVSARTVNDNALGTDVRFFIAREPLPAIEGIPIHAVVSYALDGVELERLSIGR